MAFEILKQAQDTHYIPNGVCFAPVFLIKNQFKMNYLVRSLVKRPKKNAKKVAQSKNMPYFCSVNLRGIDHDGEIAQLVRAHDS